MITKTLGSTSARLLTKLAEDNRSVFSINDAQEILGSTYDATLKTLRRLTRAGWLVRLTAGRYAIVPLSSGNEAIPQVNRYVIARELLGETPYYVSHESAMDIHNMQTRPITRVIITTPRRLKRRVILGTPYRFIYAPATTLWGFEPNWVTPYEQVNVSKLERTILDGLNRPDLCAGVSQVAIGLWMRRDDFDWDSLGQYTQRVGRSSLAQRLGYLLELFDLGTASLIKALQAMIGSHYVLLDPLLPEEGTYQARWQLRLNLEPEEIITIVRT
jgi:predicted transcriptional regulator of viral defense system